MKPRLLEQPLLVPDRFSENPLLQSGERLSIEEKPTKAIKKKYKNITIKENSGEKDPSEPEGNSEEKEPSEPTLIEDSPDLSRAKNISAKKFSENHLNNPFEEIGIRTEVSRIVDSNHQDKVTLTRMNRLQSSFKFEPDRIEWRYDPFKTPPDLQLLEKHKNAKKVGYFDIYDPKTFLNTCPCCHLPTVKEPLKISCPSRKLAFLGTGKLY
jgi:hypothetical protein